MRDASGLPMPLLGAYRPMTNHSPSLNLATFEVSIERTTDGARFKRFFAAQSEAAAVIRANLSLLREPADYYVLSAKRI